MEVILKQDLENLGYKDDVVKVKPGYGRNFLLPKGYAILASVSAKKVHSENQKQKAHKEAKLMEGIKKIADAVKKATIKVGAKVGENGKIFGSIGNVQVADAIKKLGHSVERKNISIKNEPIKSVGKYQAEIRFHKNIVETIEFEVVGE